MSAIMKKKVILSSVLAVICGACLSFAASAHDTVIAQGSSIAGENGRFDIEFDGRDASFDEYVVTVGDGSTTIHIEDVLFGEVWLTGGQSNMELQLQYVIDGPELIRAARGDDRYANLQPVRISAPVRH